MFARRAVSTVARRAIAARPVVPARSFASSVRRCELRLFAEDGEGGRGAIGVGEEEGGDGREVESGLGGVWWCGMLF